MEIGPESLSMGKVLAEDALPRILRELPAARADACDANDITYVLCRRQGNRCPLPGGPSASPESFV
jgi:hypothetical protein